ncbi:MAG TPA: hypothetical protein VFP72_16960 [Kineosporiaceae bacterium]|nr:hypothetical protein [Kineosporiaceae bacterium]
MTMTEMVQPSEVISESDAARLKGALAAEVKTWHYLTFPTPTAAANFVNLPPAQGAGEAIFTALPNGQIGTFYFL